MIRLLVICLIVFVPVIAFASTGGDASAASLALQSAIAAMQVYLTSKLPPMEKRIKNIERTVADFIEGVVR